VPLADITAPIAAALIMNYALGQHPTPKSRTWTMTTSGAAKAHEGVIKLVIHQNPDGKYLI
jgi:hypothetical protein